MNKAAILAVSLTVVGVDGAWAADDTFSTFKSICIDTGANQADSLAVADKTGWMPMPDKMMDSFPLKGIQGKPQGRIRSDANGFYLLATANSLISEMGNASGDMCMMGFTDAKSDFAAQAQAFAAVPGKKDSKESSLIYIWRDDNGAHVPLGQPNYAKLQGPFYFLGTGQGPKISFLAFGVASLKNRSDNETRP